MFVIVVFGQLYFLETFILVLTLRRLQAALEGYLDNIWSDPKGAGSLAIIQEILSFAILPLATVGIIEANQGAVAECDGLFSINSLVFHVRTHIHLMCF